MLKWLGLLPFSAEQIDKIIADKDSENTKKSTKLAKHVFFEYLSEKKLAEPTEPSGLAKCLRFLSVLSFIRIPDFSW